MSTITTNFPRASVSRARVQRSADGVVADYIRALAGASSANARPRVITTRAPVEATSYATATAVSPDVPTEGNQSRVHNDTARSRKGSCWNRGGRASRALRAQRSLEAR